jgi:hypothetical protein
LKSGTNIATQAKFTFAVQQCSARAGSSGTIRRGQSHRLTALTFTLRDQYRCSHSVSVNFGARMNTGRSSGIRRHERIADQAVRGGLAERLRHKTNPEHRFFSLVQQLQMLFAILFQAARHAANKAGADRGHHHHGMAT